MRSLPACGRGAGAAFAGRSQRFAHRSRVGMPFRLRPTLTGECSRECSPGEPALRHRLPFVLSREAGAWVLLPFWGCGCNPALSARGAVGKIPLGNIPWAGTPSAHLGFLYIRGRGFPPAFEITQHVATWDVPNRLPRICLGPVTVPSNAQDRLSYPDVPRFARGNAIGNDLIDRMVAPFCSLFGCHGTRRGSIFERGLRLRLRFIPEPRGWTHL